MSKPFPGKGGITRDQEITQLMQELQAWHDHPVGSPEEVEYQLEQIRAVLGSLSQAANPGARHTSAEVTKAIKDARDLLASRQ